MRSLAEHRLEREVLLLAARPGTAPQARTQLETLLADGIDWTVLVRSAMKHRLVPLLDACLQPVGPPRVPRDITHALRIWSARNRDSGRQLETAVAEIADASIGKGIDALFMLGPPQARQAYGRLDLQQAVNPVLLLRESDLDRFDTMMATLGYLRKQARQAQAALPIAARHARWRIYSRPDTGTDVEVQTALRPAKRPIFEFDALRERAVDQAISGVRLNTLSLEDLLLLLCLRGGVRKWTILAESCDLAWLLERHPQIDLIRVRARARALRVERLLLLGLALVRQVLGISLDAAVTDLNRVQSTSTRLAARLVGDLERDPGQSGLAEDRLNADPRAAISASARNRLHWGKRSDAWEKWSVLTRQSSAKTSRALMAAAGIAADQSALDIACGVGDTSLELSPAVGPRGVVVTTDLAFDMIARARQRANDEGLDNLRYCGAAMESLPFGARRFDAIVCRLGIMYCPDVQRALAEALRVLRPGGRAAYLVCGSRQDNPLLRIVHEVATELFEFEERDAAIDPFRFAAAGSLADEMTQAGFRDVREQDLTLRQRAPIGTRFWQPGLERGISLALEDLPRDTRHELERRMVAAFEPYLQRGFYELPSLSRITRGTSPE